LQPVRQKEPLLVKFEMARLRKATVLEKVTNRSDRYFVGVSNERSESQQEGFKLSSSKPTIVATADSFLVVIVVRIAGLLSTF